MGTPFIVALSACGRFEEFDSCHLLLFSLLLFSLGVSPAFAVEGSNAEADETEREEAAEVCACNCDGRCWLLCRISCVLIPLRTVICFAGERLSLLWNHGLKAKELKNVIARIAKYSEWHQHVFVGTRCLADHQKVKAGEVNIVMTAFSSKAEVAFDELKRSVKRYATSSHEALFAQDFADVGAWIRQNGRLPSRTKGSAEATVYATFAKLRNLRQAPNCELTAPQCDMCDGWAAWIGVGKLLGGVAEFDADDASRVPDWYVDMRAWVGQHGRLPYKKPTGCNEAASVEKVLAGKWFRERTFTEGRFAAGCIRRIEALGE